MAYAKANPDKLNFAHAGVGATSQLCEVLMKSATGAKWTSIPYKGTGPALNDMLGGQVDLICDQPASTLGHIKSGNLKPIAVATPARLKSLPQVPTFAESGLAGFELAVWHGLYAPKGTPKSIVDKLAAALQQSLHALRWSNHNTRWARISPAPSRPTRTRCDVFSRATLSAGSRR